ncbi:MAG: peptide MFS transporter [Saprospiraceae bacterium]|nr:peptide MFS transporter [Saprospiraceae bacterium]
MTKDPSQRTLFGHPVGLFILFFTEMWERFSYYGMRAILTLYMITSVADKNPGLGWDEAFALSIYGWYTMLVYVMSIPGGILADKFIGQKKSVLVGGLVLVLGHSILAIDAIWAFYLGLVLIIIGVGCLKPNISTMVGGLYKQGDPARDQGFTIFYIGINIGAFLAALVVGVVSAVYGWHYGFGLAGIGMAIGQLTFMWGQKFLKGIGDAPEKAGSATVPSNAAESENSSLSALFGRLLKSPLHMVITVGLMAAGVLAAIFMAKGAEKLAYSLLSIFVALVIGMMMMVYQEINKIEKDRFVVLLIAFLLVIVFWGAFEQAGGLMNIYTLKKIDRVVPLFSMDIIFYGGALILLYFGFRAWRKKMDTVYIFVPIGLLLAGLYGWLRTTNMSDPYEIPTAVFQSVNALFIIIFGTLVGGFWIWWQRSGREASSVFKMAIGTIIMGVGFLFMAKASIDIVKYGDKAAVMLLILAYLFHTIGELCISPVALSFVTKLAPVKYVSLMMGVYFAATGFGNKLAGTIGEISQKETVHIELLANEAQIAPYVTDTTIATGSNFEIVGQVFLQGNDIVVKDGQTDLATYFSLDEKNKEILKTSLDDFENSASEPLTAILSFEKDPEKEVAGLGYRGDLEVFEIQDNQELRTFFSIFIFTALFGSLLILFIKRLKRLSHGAEDLVETGQH